MDIFTDVLELLGTVAFAASGAMTGMRKNMDVFGVCILGLVTAVGGGVLRDVVLGNTPPATFQDPTCAMVSVAASLILFFPGVRRVLLRHPVIYEKTVFIMDTAGLGIFTVLGIGVAKQVVSQPGLFLLIFVGTVTGVGGGVLRDMMAGDMPYIFVKHIYACASLAGACAAGVFWPVIGEVPAMLLGCSTVVLIRGLSAYFRWNLPTAWPVRSL